MKMKNILIAGALALIGLSAQAVDIMRGEDGLLGLIETEKGQTKWIVRPKYVTIYRNTDGSYLVYGKNNKWGLISNTGEEIIPCNFSKISDVKREYEHTYNPDDTSQYADFTLTRDYTGYIRDYVDKKINEWLKKNEFEKTEEYQDRVSDYNRKRKIEQVVAEVCAECLLKVQDKKLPMTIREYDADHETYKIETPIGDYIVPVSFQNAQLFKQCFPQMTTENTYDIVDGKVVLRTAVFSYNNKVMATYSNQVNSLYAHAADGLSGSAAEMTSYATTYKGASGKSDVDRDIPYATDANSNDHTFALIIANENYKEESKVNYAYNDGEIFYKYLNQTLGIPASNIKLTKDATINQMRLDVDWLKEAGRAYNGDIKVILYYAGHGIPDESTRDPYLIPSDGAVYNRETLFPLKEFYEKLGEIDSECTVLFLDACFTGSKRDDQMLSMARGVKLRHGDTPATNKLVVFSAAQVDETAWGYDEQLHGLFTYFLLKKLQESKGNTTLGDLSKYITDNVKQRSVLINHKIQTPTVSASIDMQEDWRFLKLR